MRLVAVETPVAGRAETHRTVRDGDVMRMEPAEIVEVPAGAQVEFAPGGLHIMLMDLKQPLNKGDSFPMTLRFDSREAIELTVQFLGPASRGATERDGRERAAHFRLLTSTPRWIQWRARIIGRASSW